MIVRNNSIAVFTIKYSMTHPTLVPELMVSDFKRSLVFYTDLLGFHIDFDRPESGFAYISLGGAHFMLEQTGSFKSSTAAEFEKGEWRTGDMEPPFGRGINFEITVEAVDPLYDRLIKANYPIKLELHEKQYRVAEKSAHVRQFLVLDPDGYLLRFSELLSLR